MSLDLKPVRDSFERRDWRTAFDALSAAKGEMPLPPEDLERLAISAYMLAKDDVCEEAWTEAHHAWLGSGEVEHAAYCALAQALGLFFRGDLAPGLGWVSRGARVMEHGKKDCVEQAWLLMLSALPALFEGDATAPDESFTKAAEIAELSHDADATAFSRLGLGFSLILKGQVSEAMALLDEVMVAVTADEVSPMIAGIAYCQVIDLCQSVFDLRRAKEWTAALTRWCDSQPDLVPFRGNCLVHRCEIFQLQGEWLTAIESARQACDLLTGPPAWDTLGSAYYQLGEIQRLRGELSEAEASYRQARLAGRDPEPGMSLLRMTQGRVDLALPAIRRALEEANDPCARSRLIPAYIEIALAANQVGDARIAADELETLANEFDAPFLRALATHSSGAVLLAQGTPSVALPVLRTALRSWRDLDVPHQAARVRLLIGHACRDLGDVATAELEWEVARDSLEKLGAIPDLKGLALVRAGGPVSGPLSRREAEVLAQLATGKSNREIAAQLFISEKTVARHLSNIFMKLQVGSRAEATAYAYRHGLVS